MTTDNRLKNFESKPIHIAGFSTINHNLRVKLKMNCSEYVILDYIHNRQMNKKLADTDHCYTRTGFSKEEQRYIITSLIKKGFILPPAEDASTFTLTSKWTSALSSLETEFERGFWVKLNPRTNRLENCWHGSKSQAKKNYTKVRKIHSYEFLVQKRDEYFQYLEAAEQSGFLRQKMMCSVFLGPQERFLEDWAGQRDEVLKKLKNGKKDDKPRTAMTMDEVKKLYSDEKNTDK